jgi:hypothetical protein
METNSLVIEGKKIQPLIDSLKDEFSATSYLSRSGSFQILILEKYYQRISSNLAAFIVFDFEGDLSCRVLIVSAGGTASGVSGLIHTDYGAESSFVNQIRKSIEKYADEYGLKVRSIVSLGSEKEAVSPSEPYGQTPPSFLKTCVECGKKIPVASEECKYCGASQTHKK